MTFYVFLLLCLYGSWLHKCSANGHVMAMAVQFMEAGESLYGERHKEGSVFNMGFILLTLYRQSTHSLKQLLNRYITKYTMHFTRVQRVKPIAGQFYSLQL